MLVDILFDDDSVMLARVNEETPNGSLLVQFFVPIRKKYNDMQMYNYEETVTEVGKESVCGRYETSDEQAAGYTRVSSEGFVKEDLDDSEYEPESESESEPESLDED